MIQCTEPATPAVIVCCELPPYRFATGGRLGLKTPSPITVLLERGDGFFRQLRVKSFPHFGKEQIKRRKTGTKEERPAQEKFRQMKTDSNRRRRTGTVSLVDVIHSLDNKISPPKFIWSAQP